MFEVFFFCNADFILFGVLREVVKEFPRPPMELVIGRKCKGRFCNFFPTFTSDIAAQIAQRNLSLIVGKASSKVLSCRAADETISKVAAPASS